MVASNGFLVPNGPAYKALVMHNQTHITPAAAAALLRFTESGLPIFVVGSAPNVTIGKVGQQEVSADIQRLLAHTNVHIVSPEEFGPERLASTGVHPRARIVSATDGNASQLYSVWRSDAGNGTDAIFLYNKGPAGLFRLQFATLRRLYPLDHGCMEWQANQISGL